MARKTKTILSRAARSKIGQLGRRGIRHAVIDDLVTLNQRLDRLEAQNARGQVGIDLAQVRQSINDIWTELTSPPYVSTPYEIELDGRQVMGYASPSGAGNTTVVENYCDVFRPSEDELRKQLAEYIPYVERTQPILEIGCGRGEFLEICRDRKLEARGLDLDEMLVEHCRSKSLDVVCDDAIHYLEQLPDNSVGAIFSAQVIEHLDANQLTTFFRLAHDKLIASGRLIAETVNPHRFAALRLFWVDTTHVHPLYPETMLAICQAAGYARGHIRWTSDTGDPDRDRVTAVSYAVIADKG